MVDMKAVDARREKLGIPKTVIATKCGVTVNTYDNWIKNPDNVSGRHCRTLADSLAITDTNDILAIFFVPNVQENVNN